MRRALTFTALALVAFLSPYPAFAQNSRPSPREQGQLDAHPALFAVLTAVNAAGYDDNLDSPTNSPLRAAVRKWVDARHPPSLARLKQFYEDHRQADPSANLSQYISFALTSQGPPDFKPLLSDSQMPPDALALEGFSALLVEFYREADLESAWKQAQPLFEQAIARYHEPVTQAVLESNAYLRNPTSGTRGHVFQVFVDLLGAPNQVHTRVYGDYYFVVVTPSVETRTRDIRHAYLDYLVDPLAIRNSKSFDKKKGLGDLAQASPILADDYKNDFVRLASMCIVRAVEARLDGPSGSAYVDQSMKEGFILTAYFYEALPSYEKQDLSFGLYMPELIDHMDVAKEDKRIAQVEFVTKRATRVAKSAPKAPPPPLTGPAADLAAAIEFYAAHNFSAARNAYRKVIEQSADKPLQAKAFFGLGRIAALEKHPELAVQMLERTLELEPEPFERAWAYVYLARLVLAAEEPETEAALKYYQAALAVQGASEGATKAARQELAAVTAAIKQSKP
ncbi:tetratricopeptide repeat protein [uncultured Paludibaculum sp.]|uniref:tetratricopeptide repeat protein n=1 Tax=uncultured Paludibaculum sp. TaxID=1765020 RepID=UPI002AAB9D63|nr:tetratricopeptide repeat protein [uncultured Paludibaculum sp.]